MRLRAVVWPIRCGLAQLGADRAPWIGILARRFPIRRLGASSLPGRSARSAGPSIASIRPPPATRRPCRAMNDAGTSTPPAPGWCPSSRSRTSRCRCRGCRAAPAAPRPERPVPRRAQVRPRRSSIRCDSSPAISRISRATSAVVAAAHAHATSRTSTLCSLPSLGTALSKNMASAPNGSAEKSVLSTPPNRSTTHSRLDDRTISSASALVPL